MLKAAVGKTIESEKTPELLKGKTSSGAILFPQFHFLIKKGSDISAVNCVAIGLTGKSFSNQRNLNKFTLKIRVLCKSPLI